MAKLEIPVVADISKIESLIDEIKHLQTYKLSYGDEQILIDRDDVIKIFATHVRANIEPERKKGHWIRHDEIKNVYGGIYIECSECGEKYVVQHILDEKYCRNCGADMRGEQDG